VLEFDRRRGVLPLFYAGEELIERGRTLEMALAEALGPLAGHPLIAEVRAGLGFMAGIEVTE
jgi:putrescine---pyruvate transaminase